MIVSADRKPKADRIHLEGIRMGKLSFVSVSTPTVQCHHRLGAIAKMLGV